MTAGYGDEPVIHDVSLSVSPGELLAVIGPNGAGKSTLLRAVLGGLRVQRGEVRLDGAALCGKSRPIGDDGLLMLSQTQSVFRDLTVAENIGVATRAFSRRPSDRRQYRERVWNMLGVDARGSQTVNSLSGGERQWLALSIALAVRPAVFLLDEPLLNLSPSARKRALATIVESLAQRAAAIVVEQNVHEIIAVASRVVVMRGGRVVRSSPSGEITDEVLRKDFFA